MWGCLGNKIVSHTGKQAQRGKATLRAGKKDASSSNTLLQLLIELNTGNFKETFPKQVGVPFFTRRRKK